MEGTMKQRTIWTVGKIAEREGVGRHRVEYLIDARGIRPIGTAGIARVFAERDADFIGEELRRMDAARRGGADD
jgi:hypothetical protein